jgi:dimethylamine/trimethylamine dehydrogenase
MKFGVKIYSQQNLKKVHIGKVVLACSFSGQTSEIDADAVVLVTDRLPNDELYQALKPAHKGGKLDSLRVIGDAEAPNIIAQAVFSGHLAAREFESAPSDRTPFRIERVEI